MNRFPKRLTVPRFEIYRYSYSWCEWTLYEHFATEKQADRYIAFLIRSGDAPEQLRKVRATRELLP